MQITVLEKTPAKATFLISKAGENGIAFVNALRRAIISQLPAFAMEDITFYENNSALYNEYIANRLGLVPLTWEEGIADDAKISLTLSMDGPCTVYSRDIKSTDDTIKVYSQNIPVAVLGLDQRLRFEAVAIKGTSKAHAKFQSAHAAFANLAKMTAAKKIDDELVIHEYPATSEKPEEFAKKHMELCDYNLEYVRIGDSIYKIELEPDEYLFTVESYNNIEATKQFWRGVSLLKAKLTELAAEIK